MSDEDIRQIVFDTETTGFDPAEGHKIIEIGAVEVLNYIPTGKTFHRYINPERDVPLEAVNVHGLTEAFLKDYDIFSVVVPDFLEFIGDAALVAHNAEFDMNFMNYQLKHGGFPILKNQVIDTLVIARQKFPGAPANLDALCRRYDIDNSNREFHGALLDSELLAEVYIELMGGRQRGLELDDDASTNTVQQASARENTRPKKPQREPRIFELCESELKAHQEMLEKEIKSPIWNQ